MGTITRQEKLCHRCNTTKPLSAFGRNKARKDGVQVYCTDCMRDVRIQGQYDKKRWANNRESESARSLAYRGNNGDRLRGAWREHQSAVRATQPWKVNASNKARKARQRQAMPVWADKTKIAIVYQKAKTLSASLGIEFQVDHVVPLRGKTVCGLHVHANLQLLEKTENHKKRHYKWPDMP